MLWDQPSFLCAHCERIQAVAVQLYWHLTSALNGGEWSVSCPDCRTSAKRAPCAPQPIWKHQNKENVFPMPGTEHLQQWSPWTDSSLSPVHFWFIHVRSTCTVTTDFLQSFTQSSVGMKCHYKIQTIFDTYTCTALCTKLFYPMSSAVNVLPFQLLLWCTLHSSSDIPHHTSALTTQVAAHKDTQKTAERNRINTHCTI
jgi:hypothetical protein